MQAYQLLHPQSTLARCENRQAILRRTCKPLAITMWSLASRASAPQPWTDRSNPPTVPPEAESALIYRKHRRALVDYADGIVHDRSRAEDVVQEAWERIEAIERKRLIDEPLRYFYRVVRNLALDGHRVLKRQNQREMANGEAIAETIPDESPTQEARLIARQELQQVLAVLDELPERTRQAVMMHAYEGAKLREIAERLNISIGLTHRLVSDGKAHIAQRIEWRP